jgi:hypothetical protein
MRFISVLTGLSFLMCSSAFAVGESEADLLKNLPASKQSLIQAIEQVSKMGDTPTAAKFEYEDGALHLAVYSTAKGTNVDAEHSVLKEFKGDPKQVMWKPEVEVFKDVEHVARSAEYHTLMELSPSSLADIATKAQALGTVVWVIPMVAAGKPTFDVGVFSNGKLQHVRYGLLDGKKE